MCQRTGSVFTSWRSFHRVILSHKFADSLFRSRRESWLAFAGHRVSLNHELAPPPPRRFQFFTSGENRVLRLWRRTRTHSLDTFVKNYFADAKNMSHCAPPPRHISFCCKMFRENKTRRARTHTRQAGRLRNYYYWHSASLRFICLANQRISFDNALVGWKWCKAMWVQNYLYFCWPTEFESE